VREQVGKLRRRHPRAATGAVVAAVAAVAALVFVLPAGVVAARQSEHAARSREVQRAEAVVGFGAAADDLRTAAVMILSRFDSSARDALLNKAVVLADRLDREGEAVPAPDRLLELEPGNADARGSRGAYQARLGRAAEARRAAPRPVRVTTLPGRGGCSRSSPRATRRRRTHEAPTMTEVDRLASTDPTVLPAYPDEWAAERKLRLFSAACCRRIWHLLTDEWNRAAIEAIERHADERPMGVEMPCAGDGAVEVIQTHCPQTVHPLDGPAASPGCRPSSLP